MRLKIYSNFGDAETIGAVVPPLIPLAPRLQGNLLRPARATFDRWMETGAQDLKISNLSECDLAVLSFDYCLTSKPWDSPEETEGRRLSQIASRFIEEAAKEGKPVLIFDTSDLHHGLKNMPHVSVMTASVYRSSGRRRIVPIPAWGCDMAARYSSGIVPELEWEALPKISFCGAAYVPPMGFSWRKRLIWELKRGGRHLGLLRPETKNFDHLRRLALEALWSEGGIESHFIVRPEQWDSHRKPNGDADWSRKIVEHAQFAANMLGAPYHLCVKGFENYSFRFYEALSWGRIPVWVDSDMVMPCEKDISWQDVGLRIPEEEISQLPGKLIEWNRRQGRTGLRENQNYIKHIWNDHLRPELFLAEKMQELAFPELTREKSELARHR